MSFKCLQRLGQDLGFGGVVGSESEGAGTGEEAAFLACSGVVEGRAPVPSLSLLALAGDAALPLKPAPDA